MSILVTGATGTIGTETLRLLNQKGVKGIRALVRSAEKARSVAAYDVEPAMGSFEDQQSLELALSGVETVVLITPAGPEAEEHASNVINAAKRSVAQRLIRISAIKADPDGPTNNTCAHGRTEAEITNSGLCHVILRPNLFMQNMFMAADQIGHEGQFSFAMGDGKMGMIDTRDIAACAAECALSDQWDGQIFELTGPEAISYSDAAANLSALMGKPVAYAPVTPDDMHAIIEEAGWGEWMAALARDYGKAYASGWGEFTTKHVREITGRLPRTFRDFAKEVFLPVLQTG
ncbi:SDR family oxidoreductase [uncultured Ruegeria sp.]|uniref:SDR family oxidoreductase n=1 Tax=uncultured Ruegeria sp. TaxID=259304 RepID=UPI00262E904B|nr:SDR family oxidoreductase [uncultured Ruegeria sp.]